MANIQIGDRVKLVGNYYSDGDGNPVWGGREGKIKGTVISGINEYRVRWDNGIENSGYREGRDLELLKSNKTIMQRVSNMMKKLLDADTQVLVKAGYINGDLELTDEGIIALETILFMENKKEMVKLANEKIAEEEKSDK